MILGSNKSWAELDYSYQLIKILISKLFEQLLNSFVAVIQPPGFNDYGHFFPISLCTLSEKCKPAYWEINCS